MRDLALKTITTVECLRRLRAFRRARGLCLQCGLRQPDAKSSCHWCLEKCRARYRKRRPMVKPDEKLHCGRCGRNGHARENCRVGKRVT
jgi:hypothetical protein